MVEFFIVLVSIIVIQYTFYKMFCYYDFGIKKLHTSLGFGVMGIVVSILITMGNKEFGDVVNSALFLVSFVLATASYKQIRSIRKEQAVAVMNSQPVPKR